MNVAVVHIVSVINYLIGKSQIRLWENKNGKTRKTMDLCNTRQRCVNTILVLIYFVNLFSSSIWFFLSENLKLFLNVNQEKVKFKIFYRHFVHKNCDNEHQMAFVISFRRLLQTYERGDRFSSPAVCEFLLTLRPTGFSAWNLVIDWIF